MNHLPAPGASHPDSQAEPTTRPLLAPVPSSFSAPLRASSTSSPITPIVCDDRAIARLLETLLERAGLSTRQAATALGFSSSNAVRQYISGRRAKPSLLWFVKFVEMCGGQLYISFPPR